MSTVYCREKGHDNTKLTMGKKNARGAIFIGVVTEGVSEEVTFGLRHEQ